MMFYREREGHFEIFLIFQASESSLVFSSLQLTQQVSLTLGFRSGCVNYLMHTNMDPQTVRKETSPHHHQDV